MHLVGIIYKAESFSSRSTYGSGLNTLPSISEFATSPTDYFPRQSLWSNVPLQSKRLQPPDGYRNVPHRANKFRMAGVWRDRDVVFFHVYAGTYKSEILAVHRTHCRDVETGRWGVHHNPSTHTVVVGSGAAASNSRLVTSQTISNWGDVGVLGSTRSLSVHAVAYTIPLSDSTARNHDILSDNLPMEVQEGSQNSIVA